jgi:hypothetical protein
MSRDRSGAPRISAGHDQSSSAPSEGDPRYTAKVRRGSDHARAYCRVGSGVGGTIRRVSA